MGARVERIVVVKNSRKGEPVRWEGFNGTKWRGGAFSEKSRDFLQRATSLSCLKKVSPNHAHHLVEKARAGHPENELGAAFFPEDAVDSPRAVIGEGGGHREVAEIMGSKKEGRGLPGPGEKKVWREGGGEGGGQGVMGETGREMSEDIPVYFPSGAMAGVKRRRNTSAVEDSEASRKPGVENSGEPVHRDGKSIGKIGVSHLAPGGNACIGPS